MEMVCCLEVGASKRNGVSSLSKATLGMDIVQASFQASFDSRVERLGDGDLADLRQMFRYFDTDGDGAVSADASCRMFALLGLDVNMTQVRELGEVYLNEFIKIVDSHVHVAPLFASGAPEVEVDAGAPAPPPAQQEIPLPVSADETARKLWDDKVLEDEWKLLDTYRRGRVSMQELRLFLGSCRSSLSLEDTERFLEAFGSTRERDGVEELEFTKEGFLKFRREYKPKMAVSEDDWSTDDEDEHGLVANAATLVQSPVDRTASTDAANGANATTAMRLPSRHAERGPSDDSFSSKEQVLSSMDHEFVVNPDELVESDESEEEAEGGKNGTPSFDTARS